MILHTLVFLASPSSPRFWPTSATPKTQTTATKLVSPLTAWTVFLWLLTPLAFLHLMCYVLFSQKNARSKMVTCLSSSLWKTLKAEAMPAGKRLMSALLEQLPARIRRPLFSAQLWKWENASSLTNKKPTQPRSGLWPLLKGTHTSSAKAVDRTRGCGYDHPGHH